MGEHNCGLWLADWYVEATARPDPAEHLRGRYGHVEMDWISPAAVLRHLKRIAPTIGLIRVKAPGLGDIAVLALRWGDGKRRAVGAIRVEGGWVVPAGAPDVRGLTKLADGTADVIAAWRFPECPSSQHLSPSP